MIVVKFGGTSVGSAERIQQVGAIIKAKNQPLFLVFSAMSGVTNTLVQCNQAIENKQFTEAEKMLLSIEAKHKETAYNLIESAETYSLTCLLIESAINKFQEYFRLEQLPADIQNQVLALGEQLSTLVISTYFNAIGLKNNLLNALDLMRTNAEGEPDLTFLEHTLTPQLNTETQTIFITQGFICMDHNGLVSNLQRGGSDYTASLIGAAIKATSVEIWTDIDGMHNNDPRVVENTQSIPNLSFDEAAELAYFGAKILHPSCIHPARVVNIPVVLKNTMQPNAHGTIISTETPETGVKAIAAKDGITAIRIKSARMLMAYGFLQSVFSVFAKYKTPIDMITTSEVAVSLTIDNTLHLTEIIAELDAFGFVEVDQNQTIISMVGHNLNEQNGQAALVFKALQTIPVRMISSGGSRHNISILIDETNKNQALNQLHQTLFSHESNYTE